MGNYVQVILPLKLEWIPFYKVPSHATSIQAGDKVKVRFAGKQYIGVVSKVTGTLPESLPEAKVKEIDEVESSLVRITPETLGLWQKIADYYLCSIGEVYKTAYPASKLDQEAVKARIRDRKDKKVASLKEKIEKARFERTRSKYEEELKAVLESDGEEAPSDPENIELSVAQQTAYQQIREAFKVRKPVLLDGVTGSGKTEIYEKLALETLDHANVLYLVPEIALSRQLEERLRKVFGDRMMVFHSHESVASRGEVASRIAENDVLRDSKGYIVLGTRSALFLPHHDLGLIIIDEEHDGSYKQDSPAPRYNGRDVAVMLAASQKDCGMVLGSATPSLESIYNCTVGRFTHVQLKERYHGAADSEVEIIDTKAERRKRGMMGSFSYKLIVHVNEALAEGSQVILLRSRRSYSPVLQCEECGDIPKCPKCNQPLSLHIGSTERLLCHHCGYSKPHDGKCKCGGNLIGLGAGTQKIEEEARALWPEAKIARLDSDISADHKAEADIIRSFAKGDIQILIGTQIVSKGFDFEGVSLVAVLQADSMLGVQDFRADEKAFQLLEQFRGRCGRREKKGLFIIQTATPEHPVYSQYMKSEEEETPTDIRSKLLEERLDFHYPPYTRIIDISVNDDNEVRAERMAASLANALFVALDKEIRGGSAEITGPFRNSMSISFAKDRQLGASKDALLRTVREFEKNYHYDGHIVIDVDPA
ncbi:MAG: primosomal protein N' [Bacteroidales bacterium]|nr:primosomal protein N' [Candidatus Cryptobacteroides caccocaballi]